LELLVLSFCYVASTKLPTRWGEFTLHGFKDINNGQEHVSISMGDLSSEGPVLARIHSECLTGDALFSLRCDCGLQLESALELIAQEKRGVIFYLRQEGRGIGLLNKIKAYDLQDNGADTVEANLKLGFDADQRDYSILKFMCDHFNISELRLMTNNPAKLKAIEELGINLSERVPHRIAACTHNSNYLSVKRDKMGHII
jgi:GTP cyclohydrolase II